MFPSVEWPGEDESNRDWVARKIENGNTVEYYIALFVKSVFNLLTTSAVVAAATWLGVVPELNQAAGVASISVFFLDPRVILGALIFGSLMIAEVGY